MRLLGRPVNGDLRESSVYAQVTGPYRRCASTSPVQRAEYADLKVYLPHDVLTKVDRMSMQHSLEVRCPLLDRRLVETAFRIPQSIKQAGRTGKHLLKQIARERLPQELLRLPKRGFTAPVGRWISGPYRNRYEAEVLSGSSRISSLLDIGAARSMFRAHVSGEQDHSYGLWALWMLERWARTQQPAQLAPSPQLEAV
jgi:asparagine synthase (glutamine-hydrolysing)